ncbi:MAG: peptidoglycan DD-metalloendopeptidase family protein [Flavobacteriales bacterium]|nr:peptidoglycan DD-metalloendopeptidase family protein [Flavobacteriales bacterium]
MRALLHVSLLMAGLTGRALAAVPPGSDTLRTDTLTALVMYGDRTLIEGEALTDDRLDAMLDSLCALTDPPDDLLRDLALYKRIRGLEEGGIIQLIDSLFELDTVPYALINEINLYSAQMPTQGEVDRSGLLAWLDDPTHDISGLYADWNTLAVHACTPASAVHDSVLLLQLTDPDAHCGFTLPVNGPLTSRFGWRDGRPHNGIDLDLEVWDSVRTAFPGVVRHAGVQNGYGRVVVVRHYNGLETYYAHLHRFKVKAGDVVDAGELIGLGGSSGRSSGSHLHFEVRFRGMPLDPGRIIDLSSGTLQADTLVIKRTRHAYAAYPKGTHFHTVAKGDHLYAIAEQYGTSIQALCDLNGITRRSILRVGQQLLVAERSAR